MQVTKKDDSILKIQIPNQLNQKVIEKNYQQ